MLKIQRILFLGAVLLLALIVWFVRTNNATEQNLKAISEQYAGYKANIGIGYADNQVTYQNNQKKYPLLSVFKLHVAVAVLDKINREKLNLENKINISSADIKENTYSPLREKYGVKNLNLSLHELLYYMVAESDNNACDILIKWVGGTDSVEKYIHAIGLPETEIKVTEDIMNRADMTQYQNRAPLHEILALLKMIDENKLFSEELHKELLSIMQSTVTGANKIKGYLPKSVNVAHKTGSSSRLQDGKKIADNDAAIIKVGNKKYYLAIMVSDSYESDETNAKIIAKISQQIYMLQ